MGARALLWGGLAAAACGAVLSVLGWYGISGERFAERQLPYLASCTVPGAALVVAGAVLLSRLPERPSPDAAGAAYADPAPDAAPFRAVSTDPPLRVPGGTLAHRPDCPLVTGKPHAVPVGPGDAPNACPVCEPEL
ncbi:hypothetical protein [Streptomyces sp. NPDC050504]|uniref:hypothetical protein n=1 Tax=Streptomyces sp. NPDC050504 TaxID=3365618 RepID=UPI0037A1D418